MTVFTIDAMDARKMSVYPVLSGEENFRRVGIAPGYELMVHAITAKSLAAQVGFQPGDEILSLNGTPILSVATYQESLASTLKEAVAVRVKRAGQEVALTIPPRPDAQPEASLGLALTTGFKLTHPSPFTRSPTMW